MTESLRLKLREILATWNFEDKEVGHIAADEAIAQIDQAYIDEGYLAPVEGIQATMTGQEWFNRFTPELLKLKSSYPNTKDILQAAKRAAGIEE